MKLIRILTIPSCKFDPILFRFVEVDFLVFSNIANVQSPGSQSPGSQSPESQSSILTNYINNNYGNNYHVADQDGTSNADALDLDDIDEIDTNNMAIYSGAPIKRSQKPDLKHEPVEIASVPSPEKVQMPKSSLLVPPSNSGRKSQQEIDADLMLNVLGDQATRDDIFAGTSGLLNNTTAADPVVPRHTLFDESSQVILHFSLTFSNLKCFYFSHQTTCLTMPCSHSVARLANKRRLRT